VKEIGYLILTGRIFAGAYYLLVAWQLSLLFIYLNRYFLSFSNMAIAIFLQASAFVAIYLSLLGNFGSKFSDFLRIVERPFLIYWFVYLALGVYFYKHWQVISKASALVKAPVKILLLLATSIIMITEANWLHWLTGKQLLPFEYGMLSCMLSVFMLFFCLASVEEEHLPTVVLQIVRLLSRYSLGIFCINGILFHVFVAFSSFIFPELTCNLTEIIVIKILGTVVLLSISLGLSFGLNRLGLEACVR
ncbi:MAG: hypothetical protein F6K10_10380, partial [Moorea sp. SIO2B7]|nr:hypothetical protein [Moorena sp. SIO2B7]